METLKLDFRQTLTFLGVLTIFLASVGQVQSTGIATGSYFLDTPLPLATFYVGEYSNGTYYACNGSNWQNFLRTDNASYLFEMCIGNMTTGGKIKVGLGCFDFDSTVTIDDEGIYIEGEATAYDLVGTVFNLTTTNKPLFKYTHASTHQFFGGISHCELRGNDGAGTIAIHIDQFFSDLWFEHLFIRDFADAGIQVDGGASGNGANVVSKVWNIWIKSCLIEENQAGLGYGIYLTDADSKNHSIGRVTVDDGCHFHANNHSVYSDNEWIFNFEFTGNTVEQEQQESIYLLGCRRGIISENRIFDIGTDASNTYSGIYIGNTTGGSPPVAIDVVDNTIGNHWLENQMRHCVELQGTCDHIQVVDNIFESWKTSAPLDPILNNSTGTDIKTEPNQGYGFPVEGRYTFDYYIFKDASTYYARNGSTGMIDYQSSSDAMEVFNQTWACNTSILLGSGDFWSYTYFGTHLKNVHNLTVIGAGKKNTMLHFNCSVGNLHYGAHIPLVNCSNVYFSQFGVNGHAESEYGRARCIQISTKSHHVTLNNLYITRANGTGVTIHGRGDQVGEDYPTDAPHDNIIEYCEIGDMALFGGDVAGEGNCIALTDCYSNIVQYNSLYDCASGQNAIDCYWNTANNLIQGNYIDNVNFGIILERDSYGDHQNNTIINNQLTNINQTGLEIACWSNTASPVMKNNKFINNWVQSRYQELGLYPTGSGMYIIAVSGALLIDNTVKENTFVDFGNASDQHGIKMSDEATIVNLDCSENTFINCGVRASNNHGIKADCANSTFRANTFIYCGQGGALSIHSWGKFNTFKENRYFGNGNEQGGLKLDDFHNYIYGETFTNVTGFSINCNKQNQTIERCWFINSGEIYASQNFTTIRYCHWLNSDTNSIYLSSTCDSNVIIEYNDLRKDGLASSATIYKQSGCLAGSNNIIRFNHGYKTEASGSLISCVNGTAIAHGMVTTAAVTTLCLRGPSAFNATFIYRTPTILSVNATHIVIEFLAWETGTWTQVPVTAVEAKEVWWTATTWNPP